MQTFSFSPPINLFEEGKWLLAETSFECTKFVFKKVEENINISISRAGCWGIPKYLEDSVLHKLKKLLKLRAKNDTELHVEEVRKRGNQTEIGDKECKISVLDTPNKEILEEIKSINYQDLEDLVHRKRLTYNEFIDVLDIK